ncbi:saccharopine dehydrogenase NADP-binding domain-containing protein [Rhodococcus sp. Z13]|uniref:Saccharopine dehydrogenase NADP-binding domain-containing protein n=1 Tax=Rhodococcus sacchari TaxID=2962047 RepID=A0ACD4DLF7_9NOCA|nr:saccharopine dehydrogenase NADP-binding domain-containing protein [Rhodococcus sp. Z13]UYP20862.1 saccharopine dehydrogenase NADP-binding domain-containing protein [Rhodococcus sp. Z13]
MTASRDLDIVVYGATGFVGRLTAAYLAEHLPAGVAVGLAGRTRSKLEKLAAELGVDWRIAEADADDPASLTALAESTRVVISTVGPYARYGMPLVQACAEAGTDYVDLTGEVLFHRESIDRFDETARRTGARIVHSCGFDSIPSDLGVHALYRAAAADGTGPLLDTTFVLSAFRGGVSGGTIDSLRQQLDVVRKDADARRLAARPYSLSPDPSKEPDLGRQSDLVMLDGKAISPELKGRTAPFVMATYNTRIVRRSNALRDWAYGRRFRYREVVGVGSSPLSPLFAGLVGAGTAALAAGLMFPPTRFVLDRLLPKPGEGPSEKVRENGFFIADLYTTTESGARYTARFAAKGDPGYKATAVMLAESALSLAVGGAELHAGGGVLTPAVAFGDVLTDRLRAAGFEIGVRRLT